MLSSERIAIAAHLHVLLRRKTGRVTDTEWMAANAEYAAEIVRFARAKALEEGHDELAVWAAKLEAAMPAAAAVAARQVPARAVPPAPPPDFQRTGGFAASRLDPSGFGESTFDPATRTPDDPDAPRYIGRLR